ncbi:MAG: rod shape-determining protein MreC [Puniceicoccales bacterium]|nr:rod shape-determining protein MreC [Puniceicoccales bacterium]
MHSTSRSLLLYSALGVLVLGLLLAPDTPFEGTLCLQQACQHAFHFSSRLWCALTGKTELVRENKALREQCQYYAYRLREQRGEKQVLKRLASLLPLEIDERFRHVYARVLRRNVQWWWNTIWIDKGRDDGIAENCGVLSAYGVVGKIHQVFRNTAIVELITSPRFRSVVHVEGDLRPILYEGQASAPWSLAVPRGRLSQLPQDFHRGYTQQPLRIVSSDLSGTFPDGISYGSSWLKDDPCDQEQRVPVALFPEIQSLRELIVLLPGCGSEESDERTGNFPSSAIAD